VVSFNLKAQAVLKRLNLASQKRSCPILKAGFFLLYLAGGFSKFFLNLSIGVFMPAFSFNYTFFK
jgi:hypothetical protein